MKAIESRGEMEWMIGLMTAARSFDFELLDDDSEGERASIVYRGPDSWAIVCFGMNLAHNGEWEWEPSVSNRDGEFLARCRWTLGEAVAELTRLGYRAAVDKVDLEDPQASPRWQDLVRARAEERGRWTDDEPWERVERTIFELDEVELAMRRFPRLYGSSR